MIRNATCWGIGFRGMQLRWQSSMCGNIGFVVTPDVQSYFSATGEAEAAVALACAERHTNATVNRGNATMM